MSDKAAQLIVDSIVQHFRDSLDRAQQDAIVCGLGFLSVDMHGSIDYIDLDDVFESAKSIKETQAFDAKSGNSTQGDK